MPWTANTWDGATYSGGRDPLSTVGVVVDPARPDLAGWRWKTQLSSRPWAGSAYAGGGVLARPTTGGLYVEPDPSTATMMLTAWWSNAPYLRITRIVGNDRQPVRGAYPVEVAALTRSNLCTNPSFETNTSGWINGANTTLTRTVGTTLAGTAFGRFKATAGGAINLTVPVAVPIQTFGLSLALFLSAQPSGALTATVAWQDATPSALTPSTATISTGNLAPYVGRWARTPVLEFTPPYLAATGVLTIAIAGNLANATADIDAVLIEQGAGTGGVYFDGDNQYANWTGTAHASSSQLAAPQPVLDRECPLDVPVRYELTAPNQPESILQSEPVTLDSNDITWLYAPGSDALIKTWVTTEPGQSRKIERGVFPVLGRRNPIAVSSAVRQSSDGSLEVVTEDFGQRDRLWAALEDGQPLLLRAPSRLGHGPGEWLSIGDVDMKVQGHGAWEGVRIFTLPYQVVDPPAV